MKSSIVLFVVVVSTLAFGISGAPNDFVRFDGALRPGSVIGRADDPSTTTPSIPSTEPESTSEGDEEPATSDSDSEDAGSGSTSSSLAALKQSFKQLASMPPDLTSKIGQSPFSAMNNKLQQLMAQLMALVSAPKQKIRSAMSSIMSGSTGSATPSPAN